MKGVILAGGEGTRLREYSNGKNKHTVDVLGQPMITYPLRTLGALGCEDVIIVTSPTGLDDIKEVVGYGTDFNVDVIYRIQQEPLGTANALQQAERDIKGLFPLICGDVFLDPTPPIVDQPTLFYNEFEFGDRHTVWVPESNELIEKPHPALKLGKKAIVFYFYDEAVFDIIPSVKNSARGELELEDLHKYYLHDRGAPVIEHEGFFGDMGTLDGLDRVVNHLQQKATGQSTS